MRYAVQLANQRLDATNIRIKLKFTNHKSIGLQGSFPCKDGDIGRNGSPNKQYVISLGIAATNAGVRTAEDKARDLAKLLDLKMFTWTPELLGKQS